MTAIRRVLTAAVIVPSSLYCIHVATFFVYLVAVLVFFLTDEMFAMIFSILKRKRDYVTQGLVTLANFAQVFGCYRYGERALPPLVFISVLVVYIYTTVVLGASKKIGPTLFTYTAMCIMCVVYCGTTMAHAVLIRSHLPYGEYWMYAIVLGSLQGDNGALWTGSLIGKHKLCPHISPAKSVEGAVGAVALATVSLVGYAHLFDTYRGADSWMDVPRVDVTTAAAMGFMYGFVGLMGDLSESCLKRAAAVKDSGTLLPGHGGVLDLVDCLLLTIPCTYHLLVYVLPTLFNYPM